jgi:methylisocitrate lyase
MPPLTLDVAVVSKKKTARLKALFQSKETVMMPFGVLPIHAQMAERAGFEAFEISGAFNSWWLSGTADAGLVTMSEIVGQAKRVVDAVDIPVFCDADTGYGGPQNVRRTVHEFIKAGVAGIHIEDQREPKKAGLQIGIEMVSDEEAVGRLQAACDARDELDPDFIIVARTDGYGAAGGSLDEAIRRGKLYASLTKVDAIFYEGLHSWEEVATANAQTPIPSYVIPSSRAGERPSMQHLTSIRQTIEILAFTVPAIQEPWNLLLETKRRGDFSAMNEYTSKMAVHRGTENFIGHGDVFCKPSYADIRRMEDKYLPEAQRRDYVNNLNAGLDNN